MSDTYRIIPYVVRSAGTDVPPEEVQAGINSLAQQTTIALNSIVSAGPSGPAGGDLSGTYPNPTVSAVHATSGTMSGVTINSSPIGQTTPAAGAFTTLTATTQLGVASGGTGRNTLSANNVLIGEGTAAVNFAAPGASGNILSSTGPAADPAFQTKATLAIASSGANTDITSLNAPALGAATATTAAAGNSSTLVATTAFLTQPGPIGSGTANTGTFTTLSATSTVSGAGFTARFATPGPIGNISASTGAFTTLNASGNDALQYTNTSGQSIPNTTNTIVTGWTIKSDRLGTSFNAGTGVFTAPATGIYQVSAQLVYAANTAAVGVAFEAIVFANGAQISQGVYVKQTASSVQTVAAVTAICSITSGQTITLQAFQNSGGALALNTVADQCWLCINRLP